MFIDVSQEFIKDGNKNKLRDEDIEKIIRTFDKSEKVEKYAEVVELNTIKENDYKLNISRYADTTEEEEPVHRKSSYTTRALTSGTLLRDVLIKIPPLN